MLAVEVSNIAKSYADKVAVDDISFTVAPGEIFGLIGPNGAGKTTTIRMMMDIIKPDSGQISILGEKLSEATKNKIGYMPEERGLYKKLRIFETIIYLASLKDMNRYAAGGKANELLERTGMIEHKRKKIEELSKGMGQIIQFIITITHDPQLVILDEPFAGLDPVNTELLRDMFFDLKNQGKTVILSAHQMNQVEELCDRILMINKGQAVLYGDLAEIKSRYKSNSVIVNVQGELGEVPGIAEKRIHKGYIELVLDGKTTSQQLLERLLNQELIIDRFEVATPSLNEIFLKEVGRNVE
jgi:ABC-2 type transport system ATP-binding protein